MTATTTPQPVWLNVASSTDVLEGFVNLDNHPFMRLLPFAALVRPFLPRKHHALFDRYRQARAKARLVRHDCRRRLRFRDGTVDHILCSHFLEHVYPSEAESILADFRRVLRPGGTLHVIVPDLAVLASRYAEARKRGEAGAADEFVRESLLSRPTPGTIKYRWLEFRGGFGLQHRWMYDRESMTARVKDAGFEILAENTTPSAAFRAGEEISAHVVARRPG